MKQMKHSFKLIDPTATVVKIKCRYCDARNSCQRRSQKEQYENKGIVSYCSLTPNRPQSRKRSKSKKRMNKMTPKK